MCTEQFKKCSILKDVNTTYSDSSIPIEFPIAPTNWGKVTRVAFNAIDEDEIIISPDENKE